MPCHFSVFYATFLKSQHFLGIFLLSPMALQYLSWRLLLLWICWFTAHFSPLILRVMKGMNVYHVSAISQLSLDVSWGVSKVDEEGLAVILASRSISLSLTVLSTGEGVSVMTMLSALGISDCMFPMIPVKSQGQNSPAFQSRQAAQRAHGSPLWLWTISDKERG